MTPNDPENTPKNGGDAPDAQAATDPTPEAPPEEKEIEAAAPEENAAAGDESTTTPSPEPEKSESEAQTEEPAPEEPPAAESAASDEDSESAEVVMEESPSEEKAPAAESGAGEVPVEAAPEEDDDGKPSAEMAAALAATAETEEPKLRKGRRMKVTLAQVGEKDCFVDYGGRSEGSIATSELKNEEGELRLKEGESFQAVVKSVGDTVVFTVGRRDVQHLPELENAHRDGVPVMGIVKSTNKGGFEVNLKGVRAFCPYSQIELGYCETPEQYVGQKLSFLVITFERGGRNIVVSRRKILEEESAAAAKETRERLKEGEVFAGVVRRLQPYGAFVDIGGIDGLVHVSEISRGHVADPKDLLKVGQSVQVKVIRIDAPGTDKERISLSMKDLESDPWDGVAEVCQEGGTVTGKVVRLTDFGAFVELAPGLDGLIHVSEMSEERIQHPSDVLQPGQEVEARVLKIDPGERRISLSLRPEGSAESSARPRRREGGFGGRPRGDQGPSSYRSEPERSGQPDVDVSQLEYSEAVELLRKKFNKGD